METFVYAFGIIVGIVEILAGISTIWKNYRDDKRAEEAKRLRE